MGSGTLLHRPELLTTTLVSFVPIASAWLAGSVMSGRTRSTRPPTLPIPNGPISIRPSAANISGWTASSSTSADTKNFIYQLVHSYPPGTMDTSLVSTDYINNPRTMNAIYLLGPRLAEAKLWGKETLAGGELNNAQLDGCFDKPDTSWSPRVLKDGSDSVGIMGALNRVYINIGLYSEEWLTPFQSVLRREADHRRSRSRQRSRTPPIGAPPRPARRTWRSFS